MLKWTHDEGSRYYLGFVDGDLLYRVFECDGWEWEDMIPWEGGCGYDTPEKAMQAANDNHAERQAIEEALLIADLEISMEEALEILGDELAHEYMERTKCFND